MKHVTNIFLGLLLAFVSFSVYAEDDLPAIGLPPPPSSDIPDIQDSEIKVSTQDSLTDNIKSNEDLIDKQDDSIVDLPAISTTIADKISSIGDDVKNAQKTAGETLSDMIKDHKSESVVVGKQIAKKVVRRSNASVFDISGAMLRMTPQQIEEALTRKGYKKTVQKMDIPNFIRWRNEEKCRAQGVVGYERLESCVVQMAKKDNHMFIERVFYAKYDSQEEMEVRFTSNFTQNKSYYLDYKSGVLTNLRGNSQKEFYLRNIKIYDFWKKVNQKYGAPDNKDNVIWGLGGNKAYLQAGTGRLRLEDPSLRDLDYTRMSTEDKKFMNTGLYNF